MNNRPKNDGKSSMQFNFKALRFEKTKEDLVSICRHRKFFQRVAKSCLEEEIKYCLITFPKFNTVNPQISLLGTRFAAEITNIVQDCSLIKFDAV
jgi:hypothetical protein